VLRGWTVHPKGIVGRPDILFSDAKIAFFLDGCFWHGRPECGHIPLTDSRFWRTKIELNRERDLEKSAALVETGLVGWLSDDVTPREFMERWHRLMHSIGSAIMELARGA
jgi:DNA mismatch endonuclease Vsr